MEEDGLDGALVGVLVKKSFLVRCVVVCLWDACVMMLFSSASRFEQLGKVRREHVAWKRMGSTVRLLVSW